MSRLAYQYIIHNVVHFKLQNEFIQVIILIAVLICTVSCFNMHWTKSKGYSTSTRQFNNQIFRSPTN